LTLEQGRDVVPATPLILRHVGEGAPEQAVGSREVTLDVPHQAAQLLAPPRDRATLLGYLCRQAWLAVLQQVAYPLPGDPLVPGEGGARPVERRAPAGARLASPLRLLRRPVHLPPAGRPGH